MNGKKSMEMSQEMIPILTSEISENYQLNYHLKYSNEYIQIFQFLNEHIKIEKPKMIEIIGNTLIIFVYDYKFVREDKKLNLYIKMHRNRSKLQYKIRLRKYSTDLHSFVKKWFPQIPKLNVQIKKNQKEIFIELNTPSKFLNFVLGKDGREIQMLKTLLEKINADKSINFKITVINIDQ